jgi:hypothetical protein
MTPDCPLCRQPPAWVLGGGRQAFCGNEDCDVITWDPARSLDDNLTAVSFIRLQGWGGPR